MNKQGLQDRRTIYEVHRHRPDAVDGPRKPLVEVFHGLDRARLAALGYALDGTRCTGDDGEMSTGIVSIHRVLMYGDQVLHRKPVDVIDERIAFNFLHGIDLPRPEQVSVSAERLAEESNRLERLGF